MKIKLILCLLSLISLNTHAGCRVPKSVTVCDRHCVYNYWGPGVHCDETCTTKKVHVQDGNAS